MLTRKVEAIFAGRPASRDEADRQTGLVDLFNINENLVRYEGNPVPVGLRKRRTAIFYHQISTSAASEYPLPSASSHLLYSTDS